MALFRCGGGGNSKYFPTLSDSANNAYTINANTFTAIDCGFEPKYVTYVYTWKSTNYLFYFYDVANNVMLRDANGSRSDVTSVWVGSSLYFYVSGTNIYVKKFNDPDHSSTIYLYAIG